MKRVLLNNLWLRWTNEKYMLLNVFTYRRMEITEKQFELLKSIDVKVANNAELTEAEKVFYNQLKDDCQVFDEATIEEIDRQREEAFFKVTPTGSVASITITLTYDCNFKCNYCYQRNFGLHNHTMSVQDIDKINDFLVEYHKRINQPLDIKDIVLTGGEPFLEKNIATIQRIFELFPNAKFTVFTNGVNIKKYFDIVPMNRFQEIQLSLDGDDEIIRKTNRYSGQVFDSIIDAAWQAINNDIQVRIASVLSDQSIENYKAFLEKIISCGILESEKISMRIASVQKFTLDSVLDQEIYNEESYLNLVKQLKDTVKGTKISIDKMYDFKCLSKVLFRGANKRIEHVDRTCNCIDGIVAVFCPNGKVYWCDCTNPKNGILGTFNPQIDINFDKIKELLYRSAYTIEKCRKCDFRYLCNGGCPINAFGSCDEVNTPACGAFKNDFIMENLEEFI